MSRHYDEPVEVRTVDPGLDPRRRFPPGAPEAFVWRGRPHLVGVVLDHWVQRHPWWERAWEGTDAAPALEHDVWRVEAGAGRARGSGVYDLIHLPSSAPPTWRLVRVLD